MKTLPIRRISMVLVAMITIQSLSAQNLNANNEIASQFSNNRSGKVVPSFTKIVPHNEKILKYFRRISHDVRNLKWTGINGKYLANFTTSSTSNSILFNMKGNIIYSIAHDSGKQLPVELKNLIYYEYGDYSITHVAKVLQNNRTIWVVNLAGDCHLITARIENGEIEKIMKVQKGN